MKIIKKNNQYQIDLRKRRAELGLKRREFFLTDHEKKRVDKYILTIRKRQKK